MFSGFEKNYGSFHGAELQISLVLLFFFLTEVLPVTKRYACIQKQVLQVPGFAVRSFIHESHLLSLHELRNMISEIVSVSNMG